MNTEQAGSGGMLYGTEPQPQEELYGTSVAYGTEMQAQPSDVLETAADTCATVKDSGNRRSTGSTRSGATANCIKVSRGAVDTCRIVEDIIAGRNTDAVRNYTTARDA